MFLYVHTALPNVCMSSNTTVWDHHFGTSFGVLNLDNIALYGDMSSGLNCVGIGMNVTSAASSGTCVGPFG